MTAATSSARIARRRKTGGRRTKLHIGLVLLAVIVAVGALHSQLLGLIGHGPTETGFLPPLAKPSLAHPLGADQLGRDMLAMTIEGLWTSLKVAAITGILATAVGVVIAFVAGFLGGVIDTVLLVVIDLFLVIPSFPLLIAYSAFAKRTSLLDMSLILAVFSWPATARIIRSQVLSLRTRSYVDLARVNRQSTLGIIFQELLPNMLPFVALGLAASAITAIFSLVGIEIIGLGASNIIDLGLLINAAIANGALSLGVWPMFVAPIAVIVLLFFALNLINIGLDEVYNPKLRSVAGA